MGFLSLGLKLAQKFIPKTKDQARAIAKARRIKKIKVPPSSMREMKNQKALDQKRRRRNRGRVKKVAGTGIGAASTIVGYRAAQRGQEERQENIRKVLKANPQEYKGGGEVTKWQRKWG